MKALGDLRGRDADEFGTHFVENECGLKGGAEGIGIAAGDHFFGV